jgi:hypothetical protein
VFILSEGLFFINLYYLMMSTTGGSFFNSFFEVSFLLTPIMATKLPVFEHAIKVYDDPLNQRPQVREENNGKVGIYAWVNKVNNKVYVGSGDPLYVRLSDYYQS